MPAPLGAVVVKTAVREALGWDEFIERPEFVRAHVGMSKKTPPPCGATLQVKFMVPVKLFWGVTVMTVELPVVVPGAIVNDGAVRANVWGNAVTAMIIPNEYAP